MISLILGESKFGRTTSLIEGNLGGIYSKMTRGSPKNICGSTLVEVGSSKNIFFLLPK